ncbi:unnamed protein product [Adineta ricciae]|uniref:Uncharacterized protein n=1 Tax=Adineta ricciae TaxID=249248 RepID=A0A814S3R0_ADIRI|nr:unnamed protein product [Adineta ricciae]
METPNVMKKNEHYNMNSTPQLTAIQKSFAYIERAVQEHTADTSSTSQPFFIADYGCSHGANSLVAINAIIQALATGTSFYEQILPTGSVQFGYTSTALHWLSKKPCNLSKHCYSLAGQSTDEEMKLWREQTATDYRLFLEQRSKELKKGGMFLSVTLSRNHLNDTGNLPIYHNLYRSAKAVLSDEDELLNFNIQGYYRSIDEQTDPDLLKELNLELICADITYKNSKIIFFIYNEKFTSTKKQLFLFSLL